MIWTFSVHVGASPSRIAFHRSARWKSGSSAAMSPASASVKFSTPWSVLKWYLIQNRSPPAFTHINVWLP